MIGKLITKYGSKLLFLYNKNIYLPESLNFVATFLYYIHYQSKTYGYIHIH